MNFYFFRIFPGLFLMFPGLAVQADDSGTWLNDLHSRLNPTEVQAVFYPQDSDDVIALVERAKNENIPLSISGGMHSMGGQQFGTDTLHLNMSKMDDVLAFDRENGVITVEAGRSSGRLSA